ncbi:hypothetical protein HYDPIDRAFT_32925 [Hydnomerulius pinastri MD-312]|uniref:Dephospho-CoA kinase n=1 Tax=Hydnomerulius pinastri MD-312 TaxID=994086 RepID=A0A0C9V348_9AGAM|nr:hypothetical protein HYDPIDRAFT_32925 [Hydnomerulius pinastri MD-312]
MLVIGLTGGIATGKSTVSTLLASHGIPIIDADVLAREVVEPGTKGLRDIVKVFGDGVLLPASDPHSPSSDWRTRSLDRKKLGSIIFNDASLRHKLNAIVHPAVTRAIAWRVLKAWVRGEKMVVVDVPLLIEGGLWKWMGTVVLVYCSPELQLQRLMTRDNSTPTEAHSRLSSQAPISSKIAYADIVIDNSGSLAELEGEVAAAVGRLDRAVGWGWVVSWLMPPMGVLSAIWTLGWRAARRGKDRKRD